MISIRWGIIAAIAAFVISLLVGIISGVRVSYIFIRAIIFTVVFFGIGFGLRYLINNFFPEILNTGNENTAGPLFEQPDSRINITLDNKGEYAVPELYKTSGDPNELGNIDDLISGAFKPDNASKGIDRKAETDYNNAGEIQNNTLAFPQDIPFQGVDLQESAVFEKAPAEKPVFSPDYEEDDGFGGLPDLDLMARAFSSGFSGAQTGFTPASGVSAPVPTMKPPEVRTPGVDASAFKPESVTEFPVYTQPPESFEAMEPARQRRAGNIPQPLKGDFNPKELAEGLRTVLEKDK